MIIGFLVFIRPYAKYMLISWILAILILSSIPSIPVLKIHTSKADIRLDYLIHFCEYASLAILAFLTFSEKSFKLSFNKYLLITLCIIFFSLIDEFHQKIIPGRTFNPKDIASNLAGIFAALVFCLVVFRMVERQISKQ
jgi:VanZ family protein